VHAGEIGRILFLSYTQMEPFLGGEYSSAPESVTDTKQAKVYESARLPLTLPTLVFIGIDEREAPPKEDLHAPTGVPFFALDATAVGFDVASVKGEWGESRAAGSLLTPWEAGVFASARPLIDWNGRHRFCQACGARTYSLWGGWKRSCITAVEPIEGAKPCFSTTGLHNFCYPRTDPVSSATCCATDSRSSSWVSWTLLVTRCFSDARRRGRRVRLLCLLVVP
jgi:NAD+ diphosphatase